jgi:hypothetical protein
MRAARRRSLNRQLHGRAICPDVETLMGRVRFRQSADIPASLGPDVGGGKTCANRQYTRVSARCMRPRAAWDEPPSDDERMLTVNDCMQRAFDNKDDRGMHRAYANFDGPSAADARRLMRTFKMFG